MDTAIIELDSLTNAVRSTAKDDDFAFAAFAPFVLGAIGRVVVRRISLELCRAGIDQPISGDDILGYSFSANGIFGYAICNGELSIRKAKLFCMDQAGSVEQRARVGSALVPSALLGVSPRIQNSVIIPIPNPFVTLARAN